MLTLAEKTENYDTVVAMCEYLVNNVSIFAAPHIGMGNGKTGCVNEASAAGYTCHESARETCGVNGCYALVLMRIYPQYFDCVIRNTAIRRRDADKYYEAFFAAAEENGLPLRVNESGEFEDAAQLRAMFAAARRHPSVKVIGYTKRPELLKVIGAEMPDNVFLRYSLWTGDTAGEKLAKKYGVPTCTVSPDWDKVGCPNQKIAEKNKIRRANGLEPLPAWTCRMCAEKGIGCACRKDMVLHLH